MKELLIDETLYNNIISYCDLNNIKDVNFFIEKLIKKQFYIECYGELVIDNNIKKSIIEDKEKIDSEIIINNKNIISDNDIKQENSIKEPIIKNNDIEQENNIEVSVIKNNVIKTRLK